MPTRANQIRVVSGDTGAGFIFLLEDEITGEPVDLSPVTTTAVFAVQLSYEGVFRTHEIAMPKVGDGRGGLIRLIWTGGELTGADAGDFTGEVRVTEDGDTFTVYDTISVVVRERGGGLWVES